MSCFQLHRIYTTCIGKGWLCTYSGYLHQLSGLEENPGFKITLPLVLKGMYAVVFGDIFMRALYRVRPYEAVPGSANALHEMEEKMYCIRTEKASWQT